ncbi:CapA family protein [Siminovitchia acidinfaciens]|uniref:CapA family protein n=2 Tax=Siminovitchia acidinfaciens TaxID=2321395 RepID=A0A429XX15_9BACI|nr:CapA family protein [Siminovitchia acidinfaciens]
MKTKLFIITGLLVILIAICFIVNDTMTKKEPAGPLNLSNQVFRKSGLQEKSYKTEAIIAGVGDILIHDRLYEDAKTNNGYDFSPMLASVKPMLQKPDLLIANQESIPGGEKLGISSYPMFNSPQEIVDALMDAGVDMVTAANNHSLDKGEAGILSAIDYYGSKNLPYTGMYKSPKDKDDMRILSVNGIKFAVLAYAEHFNGLSVPDGKEYLVSPLDRSTVLLDIKEATSKADVVVLSIHWGDEYVRIPKEMQKTLAKEFIQNGADIIFGHHPHVLEPMEMIEKKDGGAGIVIYSLGNFLSGQKWNYKDIGGMAEILVEKELADGKKKISLKEINFHPTFTASMGTKNYRVYPLDEANEKGLTEETSKSIKQFMQIPQTSLK